MDHDSLWGIDLPGAQSVRCYPKHVLCSGILSNTQHVCPVPGPSGWFRSSCFFTMTGERMCPLLVLLWWVGRKEVTGHYFWLKPQHLGLRWKMDTQATIIDWGHFLSAPSCWVGLLVPPIPFLAPPIMRNTHWLSSMGQEGIKKSIFGVSYVSRFLFVS